MATQAQIIANRRNATKSTGPRTAEGKAAVSKNALKHGLLANGGLLLGEDADAFKELSDLAFMTFAPQTIVEEAIVEQIVWTIWRQRRIPRIEAGRHIFSRYALRAHRILGYDEQHFRAQVAEAVDKQYGPTSEEARNSGSSSSAEDLKRLADRMVENGLFACSPRLGRPTAAIYRAMKQNSMPSCDGGSPTSTNIDVERERGPKLRMKQKRPNKANFEGGCYALATPALANLSTRERWCPGPPDWRRDRFSIASD